MTGLHRPRVGADHLIYMITASYDHQIVRGTRLELHALLPAVPPALLPRLFTALRAVELQGDGAHVEDSDAAGIRYAPCHYAGKVALPSTELLNS